MKIQIISHAQRGFLPWVGKNYWAGGLNGTRVLILGESHYGKGTETAEFTKDVVRQWGQQKRCRFFTVTQKLVAGIPQRQWVSNEQRDAFWEAVAFYNYVQRFVSDQARRPPSQDMWNEATEPFLYTPRELQPRVLVVLGFRLESQLPPIPGNIRKCSIQHPSSPGFRYAKWQPKIQQTLTPSR